MTTTRAEDLVASIVAALQLREFDWNNVCDFLRDEPDILENQFIFALISPLGGSQIYEFQNNFVFPTAPDVTKPIRRSKYFDVTSDDDNRNFYISLKADTTIYCLHGSVKINVYDSNLKKHETQELEGKQRETIEKGLFFQIEILSPSVCVVNCKRQK